MRRPTNKRLKTIINSIFPRRVNLDNTYSYFIYIHQVQGTNFGYNYCNNNKLGGESNMNRTFFCFSYFMGILNKTLFKLKKQKFNNI